MSDDDDDVPLFDEEARAKNAASLHATGMSDQARCCFIDIYIYNRWPQAQGIRIQLAAAAAFEPLI